VLFDPDRFKFLEGRTLTAARQIDERIEPPLVPDGTVYRALENLLVLDGERISYRALDVEQIGSVYETMMGFRLERATGPARRDQGAEEAGRADRGRPRALLREAPGEQTREVARRSDGPQGVTGGEEGRSEPRRSRSCTRRSMPVIDSAATPDLVRRARWCCSRAKRAPLRLALHAARADRADRAHDARADPRAPAERTASRRGPKQILDLKVCDPAMGSGAFLVEACRHLGDAFIESWHAHGERPRSRPTKTR
jgi:hypothetical protein